MIKSLANGQKAALIVNECQVGILDSRYSMLPGLAQQSEARQMVPKIAELLAAFRAKKLPVFFTPALLRHDLADKQINTLIAAMSAKSRTMIEGTPESAYMPGLEPTKDDFIIKRTAGLIAFHGTALDITLRRLGVQTIVLTGPSTNIAIPGLAMAATDLGYHVVVPEDCISAGDAESHKVFVENQLRLLATITTKDEVIKAIS